MQKTFSDWAAGPASAVVEEPACSLSGPVMGTHWAVSLAVAEGRRASGWPLGHAKE